MQKGYTWMKVPLERNLICNFFASIFLIIDLM